MKRILLLLSILAFFTLSACSDDRSTTKNIPVLAYSLNSFCTWNLTKDKDVFYVISDKAEIQKYIDCEGEENIAYPDFDKYTLLLTSGTTLYGVEKVESSSIKENDTNYIYEVKVKTNLTAITEGYIVAVLVTQLPSNAKVTKKVIINGVVTD